MKRLSVLGRQIKLARVIKQDQSEKNRIVAGILSLTLIGLACALELQRIGVRAGPSVAFVFMGLSRPWFRLWRVDHLLGRPSVREVGLLVSGILLLVVANSR